MVIYFLSDCFANYENSFHCSLIKTCLYVKKLTIFLSFYTSFISCIFTETQKNGMIFVIKETAMTKIFVKERIEK